MHTILSLSVEACSTFVADTLGCLDNMLRQRFSSCGGQTYMVLPRVSQELSIMTPTPGGHLISPRWLEEMSPLIRHWHLEKVPRQRQSHKSGLHVSSLHLLHNSVKHVVEGCDRAFHSAKPSQGL